MKKRYLFMILMIVVMLFSACTAKEGSVSGDEEPPMGGYPEIGIDETVDETEKRTPPVYDEEKDNYKPTFVEASDENFVSEWYSLSEKAEKLYDQVHLEINSGYSWRGTINGEETEGIWSNDNGTVTLDCDQGDYQIAFTDTNRLLFTDKKGDNPVYIVLARGN
jgi:hypothetical protein